MKEKNDSIKQIEQFKLRIKEKSIIHQSLLEYLGISVDQINQINDIEGKTEEIYKYLKNNNITINKCELIEFLNTISYLWEMHQSNREVKYKIESLLRILQESIKDILSEKEIFSVFHFCKYKYILLILISEDILSTETIIQNIKPKESSNDLNIIKYLYPEIRKCDEKYLNQLIITSKKFKIKRIVEECDRNLEYYYEIRKDGEKEPKIVELIREDKIDEFISFIEHYQIDLNKKIQKEETIFEEYPKVLTPVEFSALFGSLAIFKYLYLKNVNIIFEEDCSNIIEYAIQGRNYEIIHLLEERKDVIEELNQNQQKYIELSIKMHYNEIFEYLISNYMSEVTERSIRLMINSRNYYLFNNIIDLNKIELKDKSIMINIFHDVCKNGQLDIVKILINLPYLDINSKNKFIYHLLQTKKSQEYNRKTREYLWLLIKIEIRKNILL